MTKPVELRDLDPQNAYIRSPRATDPAFTSGDSASRELLRHFESEAAAVNTPPSAVTPMQVRPLGTSSQGHDEPEPPSPHTRTRGLPTQLTVRLYTSHFLSTWNSRWFEFGAVLFLASIFPGTLLPMSAYALVRSGAAILLSQPVGAWIDRGDRLEVVRTSIIGQRVAVAFSCGAFWAMETGKDDLGSDAKNGLLGLTVLLACVEKLCAMVNLIAVERDWVVVITHGNEYSRRELSARMRRIDLLCKLLGPFAISAISSYSIQVAISVTLGMNVAAVAFEYIFIAQVYNMVPGLRRQLSGSSTSEGQRPLAAGLREAGSGDIPFPRLPFYFNHSAFLPSFSLALLYLTVLSFSGQMITYLISVGYTPLQVGAARTISTVFELSATWVAPRVMTQIGTVRAGIWSLSWQMVWLAIGLSWFFSAAGAHETDANNIMSATGLAVGVALSRIGLWGYDLCAQSIVQDEVETDYRGTFSTLETAFQNLFEMLSYTTTMIFSRPEDFYWPAVISVMAVYASGGLYALFVRRRRGHLFHAPRSACICNKDGSTNSV